jgi:hypothetical protein
MKVKLSSKKKYDFTMMESTEAFKICSLCGRKERLTFHHLIPKTCHSNKWFKKRFSRKEMQQGIDICHDCHGFIHRSYPHKELGRRLNRLELLRRDVAIRKFTHWIRKKT